MGSSLSSFGRNVSNIHTPFEALALSIIPSVGMASPVDAVAVDTTATASMVASSLPIIPSLGTTSPVDDVVVDTAAICAVGSKFSSFKLSRSVVFFNRLAFHPGRSDSMMSLR